MNRWDYWFDLERWHIREAARLTVCGAVRCLEKCIQEEVKLWPVYEPRCSFFVSIKAIYKLFYSGRVASDIEPYAYIQWASTKETIKLPKEMLEWYEERIEAPPLPVSAEAAEEQATKPLGRTPIDAITEAAWNASIDSYESQKTRTNDALPKRMRVYIRSLKGESYTSIQRDYPEENLTRMLQDAKDKDVAKLKGMFPHLPILE